LARPRRGFFEFEFLEEEEEEDAPKETGRYEVPAGEEVERMEVEVDVEKVGGTSMGGLVGRSFR